MWHLAEYTSMEILLSSVIILISLIGCLWVFRGFYLNRFVNSIALQKFKVIEPLMLKLASNVLVADDEILKLVQNPSLRCGVLRVLESYEKTELFPKQYLTQEKGAEGFLVCWLEYPTELGIAPYEIALEKKVSVQEEDELDYYVFKFRTKMPHWAAHFNWMIGVVGPYWNDSSPYQVPLRVFSRFNPVNSVSPESEANWVHNNINKEMVHEKPLLVIPSLHKYA
jgi:hypothetical protein